MMTDILNMTVDQIDIIPQRERNGRATWWISEDLLIRNFNTLTEDYFKVARSRYQTGLTTAKRGKQILPDTGKAWRFARLKGKFYYAYDNIPDVAPARYRSRLPHPETLAQIAQTSVKSDRLSVLETEIKYRLSTLEIEYKRHYYGYRTEQMDALARACAALQLCIDMGRERGLIASRNCQWFRDFGAVLDRLQVRYLPTNWRRLKEKTDAALTGGTPIWQVVDLPRTNNQNARKLEDQEIDSWVIQMRGMPQNFTNAHIIRKVRQMCELTGKRLPSESWLSAMLAAPAVKFLTSAGRYGERGRMGQVYRDYTPVQNALFADDAWQVDGTRVNFIPWKNAQGREEYLYMVIVRDVHSGMILGVNFSLTEDRWAYVNALNMACRMTGSLPYELMLDRFPGHNTEEWRLIEGRMQALGVKVSYKHTATGKAQLERWFETLQSVFFQESPYYYGEGVQSRRQAAHRSAEYLKAVRRVAHQDGWDQDTAAKEAIWCITRYNETPLAEYSRKHASIRHSPKQLYQVSEKPHCKTVADWQRAMLFGLMKTVAIRNNIIRTEIQKLEYLYRVDDYEVLKSHRTVMLAYELDDLGRAWIFADDDRRLLNPQLLGEVRSLERVQVFGPGADYKSLGKDTKRRNDISRQRQAELDTIRGQGSEVNLLLAGMGRKGEAEAAETAHLLEHIDDTQPRRLLLTEPTPGQQDDNDDDFDFVTLARNQY